MCAYKCTCWGQRYLITWLLWPLLSETWSLTESGVHWLARLTGLRSSCLYLPLLGFQVPSTMVVWVLGEDPCSGPLVYVANTLTTELLPVPEIACYWCCLWQNNTMWGEDYVLWNLHFMFFFLSFFLSFEIGATGRTWNLLAWNLFCRLGWPQSPRSTCLCIPGARIKRACHHIWPIFSVFLRIYYVHWRQFYQRHSFTCVGPNCFFCLT